MPTMLAPAPAEVNTVDPDALAVAFEAEDAEYLAWLDAHADELAEDAELADRIETGLMAW